ncbi:MAG: hypothetical protein ACKVQB_06255 [Bacteroidia bacterium]
MIKTSAVFKTSEVLIKKILIYYLALQLIKYGADKLFKTQFYLPEPNILFTPFGQLDKDILYWSTIGTSYSYNLFLGTAEIMAAIFILFNKTRFLGLMLAIGILVNVVAVNFSFDISVKIYSCFLLFISLVLLAPQLKRMYYFFILQKNTSLKTEPTLIFKNPFLKTCLKIIVMILIFTEAVFPYLKNKNFNDDKATRHFLHGAYQVINNADFKRFFIHREGHIIFQNTNDEMQDFKLEIDKNTNQFVLTDYELNQTKHPFIWNSKDRILKIQFEKNKLEAKAIDWKKLPVLQTQFHWTID